MSRRMTTLIALALTLTGTSACDEAPEAAFGADGEVALRPGGYGGGGVLLNTSASGEWAIDHLDTNFGTDLDGVVLEAVMLNGKYKDPIKLEQVWSEKGELRGKSSQGEHGGADFVNSVWYLVTKQANGATSRQMTISQYALDADGNHRYVFMYPNDPAYGAHLYTSQGGTSKYGEKNQEAPPQSLAVCAPDPETGGSLEAVVYGNLYVNMKDGWMKDRDNTLFIACLSGGVGKAGALWGFTPHSYGVDVLQTGTRAVRSDFCGDGTSYTKPGNALYMEDRFGIHNFGQAGGNKNEAIWTAKGAACVAVPRDTNIDYSDIDCGGWAPAYCDDAAKMDDFGAEALMHTKIP